MPRMPHFWPVSSRAGLFLMAALCAGTAWAWQGPAPPAGPYPSTQPAPAQYPSTQYPAYPQTQNPAAMPRYAPPAGSVGSMPRVVPSAPYQPTSPTRPDQWPGSAAVASDEPVGPSFGAPIASATPPSQTGPSQAAPPLAEAGAAPDVQILAIVDADPILASDVLPWVNEQLKSHKDQIPPSELEVARTQLVKQRLRSLIETKTICADARRTVPAESMKNVEKRINEVFEEKEAPNLMKKIGAATRGELEEKLRAMGTSIDRERHAFFEKTLAQQWLQEKVRKEREITHDEMLTWYGEHIKEYETPARARWQQLTVRTGRTRSKGDAWQMIVDMGNRVVVQRVPFAEVAKQSSEGTTADDGGFRVWTTQGSLVSKPLDQALFSSSLPVGRMSPIIEDEQGFHIILVLEREPAGRRPFTEVQDEIEDKIKKARLQEGYKTYLAELRKTPIWTVYDQPDDRMSERGATTVRE